MHIKLLPFLAAVLAAAFAAPAVQAQEPSSSVKVDGIIDPVEWKQAEHVTDFRQTQPLSRAPGSQPTQAWVMATPEGLAVAIRSEQDPSIPRTRQQTQRDAGGPLDRVNLYVDFDGDGRVGYNFVVLLGGGIGDATITNENRFSDDWDGLWERAVSEDEQGWSAEILIPWHVAPMRTATGGRRTIGLQLDRVIGATGERVSWPAVSYQEVRYLSAFHRLELAAYSQSMLSVTPYVVGLYDNVGHGADFQVGGDLFWKPNGRFQLSATLNPDFAQVESDQLVVNFGATETFFSEKRPFFTENQGFFDVPFGSLGGANRLIYTRRIGGGADDGSGAADVAAAAKLNGSVAGFNYGLFVASEADDAGRDFQAARVTRDFQRHGLGAMLTRVDRPFLDREAIVAEADHRWSPNAAWTVRSTVVASRIQQPASGPGGSGPLRETRDSGGQVTIDHDLGGGWRQQLYALHLGDELQLNDFGFLDRNNFNYARYDLARRVTDFPDASPYSAQDWHAALSRRTNDHGVHLTDAAAINRRGELRDGGNDFIELAANTPGNDDLITRGNGVVRVPAKLFAYYERFWPRQGDSPWSWELKARYAADGLGGMGDGRVQLFALPSYQFNDRLGAFAGAQLTHNPDWLLWRGGNLLGTYRSDQVFLTAGTTWLIDDRQQLRVRLEAIGLDAQARQAWRVAPDGEPVAVDDPIASFNLSTLAFQVRYRYELAPLSYLYIAYVRGGELLDDDLEGAGGFGGSIGRGAGRSLGDAFDLRDSEQLLVKLSYRFGI
ncbi:MAG: DUF5916 domain-containing protein [Pseudomonadota bacterium]|nr:DUF5916 domain-containing protein [Pseudomonadota bacterium]